MHVTGGSHRVRWHAIQVALLSSLATAIGCTEFVAFPDATRPDVARLNRRSSILLLGDAKDTESPATSTTQDRLLRYVQWLVAHATRPGTVSVMAICFKRRQDAASWVRQLRSLANIARSDLSGWEVSYFGPGLWVVRCIVRPARLSAGESSAPAKFH
jgi:hypothetical protein